MNGVASLLDKPTTARVEHLWQELETRCGLVGVKATPFPHFSWQVTEAYDLQLLEKALSGIARQAHPFTVRTSGLGLFSGESPIIYISIVKSDTLLRFHALLWEQLNGIAIRPARYYAPVQWVPHITLAYNDVTPANLDCAMQILAFQSFEWEIQVDNLVFIVHLENQPPETVGYRFGS